MRVILYVATGKLPTTSTNPPPPILHVTADRRVGGAAGGDTGAAAVGGAVAAAGQRLRCGGRCDALPQLGRAGGLFVHVGLSVCLCVWCGGGVGGG